VSRWASARIDELERPVGEHFGVRALAVDAHVGAQPGDEVIGERTGRGRDALYVVLEGHATFTVDGDVIDAPARTLV